MNTKKRAASERAAREMREKFGEITPDNALVAAEWQVWRFSELMKEPK